VYKLIDRIFYLRNYAMLKIFFLYFDINLFDMQFNFKSNYFSTNPIKKEKLDLKKKFQYLEKKNCYRKRISNFSYSQISLDLYNSFCLIKYIFNNFKKKKKYKTKKLKKIIDKKINTNLIYHSNFIKKNLENKKKKILYNKTILKKNINIHFVSWFKVSFTTKINILMKNVKKSKNSKLKLFTKTIILCNFNTFILTKWSNFVLNKIYLVNNRQIKEIPVKKKNSLLSNFFKSTQSYIHINGVNYLKLELIGKGGNGKVYKIADEKNKIYALKKANIANLGIECIHNYINEISILKTLKNQHRVIQIENADISFSKGILYLVFEYGECDLEYFIKKNLNSFSKIKILKILWKQMLESVYTIHQERIVHGDLKPANFILIKNSLKIIDFGISKPIQKNTTNITRNFQMGTINYMSPEAILYTPSSGYKKKFKVSRASDIWSLGCILFQMVYGQTPFYHLPIMKKIQAIVDKSLEVVFSPVNISNLKDVLKNCLQKKANLRPSIPELLVHPFLLKKGSSNNFNFI
jgi:serine/threonine-protein kinase TTK/MPS1